MTTKTREEILEMWITSEGARYYGGKYNKVHYRKMTLDFSNEAVICGEDLYTFSWHDDIEHHGSVIRSSINDILFGENTNFFEVMFGTGDIIENIDDIDLSCGEEEEGIPGKIFSQTRFYYPYHEGTDLVVFQAKDKYHKMMCSISPDKLAYLNSVLD